MIVKGFEGSLVGKPVENNPDFEDFLHGTYGVEVVLEREVGASFE